MANATLPPGRHRLALIDQPHRSAGPSAESGRVIPTVLVRRDPAASALPLFFDSPHSGSIYPAGFHTLVPQPVLRQAEDAFVDELYDAAPRLGATLLAALFPRSYIDANRALADMDPAMVEGGWPLPGPPSRKAALGSGLIWRTHYPDLPLYDALLARSDVERRIGGYYQPYRDEFLAIYDGLAARLGRIVHVNCHSMPSVSSPKSPEGPGKRRPDVVLGDADGTSCAPAITELARSVFARAGLNVTINLPYNGADLIRAHSNPALGRHSLQIELNRALYMDEIRVEKTAGFIALKRTCTDLIAALAEFTRTARG
jgi:N-formylglutamate deformylase